MSVMFRNRLSGVLLGNVRGYERYPTLEKVNVERRKDGELVVTPFDENAPDGAIVPEPPEKLPVFNDDEDMLTLESLARSKPARQASRRKPSAAKAKR